MFKGASAKRIQVRIRRYQVPNTIPINSVWDLEPSHLGTWTPGWSLLTDARGKVVGTFKIVHRASHLLKYEDICLESCRDSYSQVVVGIL